MPTRSECTHQVTQIEMILGTSHANFVRAFESLLERMSIEAFDELPSLSQDAAREKLASFVGALGFVLFQKIDHGRFGAFDHLIFTDGESLTLSPLRTMRLAGA